MDTLPLPEPLIILIKGYHSPADRHSVCFDQPLLGDIKHLYVLDNDRLLVLCDEELVILSPVDGTIICRQTINLFLCGHYLSSDKKYLLIVNNITGHYYYEIGEETLERKYLQDYEIKTGYFNFMEGNRFIAWHNNQVTIYNYREMRQETFDVPDEIKWCMRYVLHDGQLYLWNENIIYVTDIRGHIISKINGYGNIIKLHVLKSGNIIAIAWKAEVVRGCYQSDNGVYQTKLEHAHSIAVYSANGTVVCSRKVERRLDSLYQLHDESYLMSGDKGENKEIIYSIWKIQHGYLVEKTISLPNSDTLKYKYKCQLANGDLVFRERQTVVVYSLIAGTTSILAQYSANAKYIPHSNFVYIVDGKRVIGLM